MGNKWALGTGGRYGKYAGLACMLWMFAWSATPVRAVIFYSTGDAAYNTSAPAGSLAGSGWQYVGLWSAFQGTAIAPNYFLTAKHIGGAVGDAFIFNGVPYATTAIFDDPETDLRIWRVCGVFPSYAPLYDATSEIGKGVVVIGRGTQRGEPVTTKNGTKTNGWYWGETDYVMRWGENTVTRVLNNGAGLGELLQMNFDAGAGVNECVLSLGDSGGPVFIKDGDTWKLAGINYSVSGPYNTTNSGAGFQAAIYDEGGLYHQSGDAWFFTAENPFSHAGSFYSTRVSKRLAWINEILAQPITDAPAPTLQIASTVAGPYTDSTGIVIDSAARTITLQKPAATQFYRLRSCSPFRIKRTQVMDDSLVLEYE